MATSSHSSVVKKYYALCFANSLFYSGKLLTVFIGDPILIAEATGANESHFLVTVLVRNRQLEHPSSGQTEVDGRCSLQFKIILHFRRPRNGTCQACHVKVQILVIDTVYVLTLSLGQFRRVTQRESVTLTWWKSAVRNRPRLPFL